MNLTNCHFSCFTHFCCAFGLRLNAHKGRMDVMCGGSPLILEREWVGYRFGFQDVGEIHRVEIKYTLVLPSLTGFIVFCCFDLFAVSCRGDSQGRGDVDTLVLPSVCFPILFLKTINSCRGDSQGSFFTVFNSRSPPYEPKSWSGIWVLCITPFYAFWGGYHLYHGLCGLGIWHSSPGPYIVYI